MTDVSPSHTWDAAGYDASFSFVTTYGTPLLDLLDVRAGERILDIGCGTGHQAAEIAARGAIVVGLDSDSAMLEIARREHPSVTFAQADAQSAEAVHAVSGGVPFGAVLSNAALHWMPSQDNVIAAVHGVLEPGGRLVVEMGGVGNVERITAAIRSARRDIGLDADVASSWTFPSPGEQAARLEKHGFVVRLLQLVDRTTPLAEGSTAADWATMFGAALTRDVPSDRRQDFDAAVDVHASDLGLDRRDDEGPGWWIDYVRLRFLAIRA